MTSTLKNIKETLTKGENTVGISFTDSVIYCAFSDQSKTDSPSRVIEQSIQGGLIVNGEILNEKEVGKLLKEAILKLDARITFCVITIPSNLIFSNIIHVPSNTNQSDSLYKAISLILKVELPWSKDSSYTDYINHSGDTDISVSIFSALHSILNKYVSVAEHAGVKVLAIEFDSLSTLRLMKKHSEPTLSITVAENNVSIIIAYKDKINFLFSVKMTSNFNKKIIENEITRIRNYYTNETGETIREDETKLELESNSIILLGNNIENISSYPAVGASLRIDSFKSKDENISLLHISPNELFRYYKYISSLNLINQIVITISVILIFTHILFYSILSSISERNSVFSSKAPKAYSNVLEIEAEANSLIEAINMGGLIADQTNRYLPKLLKIDSLFTDGIYVSSISILGENNPISISGLALTRNQYNAFRKSLSEQKDITIASFPLGNLNIQTNIPFSVTLYTKNTKR